MILKKPSFRFSWYHRDELQIVALVVLFVLFFSRSEALSAVTLVLVAVCFAALYAFRVVRRVLRENTHIRFAAAWIPRVESRLPLTSSERSRIAMTFLCFVVLGALCIHRVACALADSTAETPMDVYWIAFLGWYWIVWTFVLGYLVFRAAGNERGGILRLPFCEGLIASLFFYHGLPTKQRIITYGAGFVAGGLPTYMAAQLYPSDPFAHTLAAVLVLPVVVLTLGGAWYATQWHLA